MSLAVIILFRFDYLKPYKKQRLMEVTNNEITGVNRLTTLISINLKAAMYAITDCL